MYCTINFTSGKLLLQENQTICNLFNYLNTKTTGIFGGYLSAESSYIRDFWEHDFYHTPRRFQLKMGILSQFIFYLRFLNVVIRGGRLAKKSKYTGIE